MTHQDAPTLAEHLADVVEDLDGVTHDGPGLGFGERVFAVLHADHLEVALDGPVATAAQRTPDVTQSARGPGWVTFRPATLDPYAIDRAEAWLRSAHRRASTRR